MCLDTISKIKPKAEGYFWKVFEVRPNGKYYNLFFEYNNYKTRKRWERAIPFDAGFGSSPSYISGFHGFARKIDANKLKKHLLSDGFRERCKVCKCKYRKGRLMGLDDIYKVIVADEMLIL